METAQILTHLRAQRERIDIAITALEALGGTAGPTARATLKDTPTATAKRVSPASVPPITIKRTVSPEGRQRMAEAQKKRYAKAKRTVKSAAKKTAGAAPSMDKSVKVAAVTTPASKGAGKPMSAATKTKLAVAAKARWAAKKAATAPAAKRATTA